MGPGTGERLNEHRPIGGQSGDDRACGDGRATTVCGRAVCVMHSLDLVCCVNRDPCGGHPLLVRKSSVSYPSVCCVSDRYGARSTAVLTPTPVCEEAILVTLIRVCERGTRRARSRAFE
jgi:hypothetical protein